MTENPSFSDFEIQMLILEADSCRRKAEAIDELLNRIGQAKAQQDNGSHKTNGAAKATLQELAFTALKWLPQEGGKIGPFETATKQDNDQVKFSTDYDELGKANATIKDRYHGPDYQHSYWLFGQDKIYRQKHKQK